MSELLPIAKHDQELALDAHMASRHGLITGASGTGKTLTLQVLAESFSQHGVPVFVADVKGDLAGISQAGELTPELQQRIELLGLPTFEFIGSPVTFWDVYGKKGHPLRATISEMGPLLLSRLMGLTAVQTGALNAVFRIADDQGLLLLDVKDLHAMLDYLGENATAYRGKYGNMSRSTLGAIQRNLLLLDQYGAEKLFGEPAFDLQDLLRVDPYGRGVINILAAEELIKAPQLYATILLWLLALLFESMPEVGDVPRPRLVFFFDEAHLLFSDTPKPMVNKIQQMVRLIRSKGVGVYFVSQSPTDVPEEILGQLGNRVQHALRAFTPHDAQSVRAAAKTFRPNPGLDIAETITTLAVGEALVSLLDGAGMAGVTQRAWIYPPHSHIGPISQHTRYALLTESPLAGKYEQMIDRESAYELLQARAEQAAQEAALRAQAEADQKEAAQAAKAEQQAQKEAAQAQKQAARAQQAGAKPKSTKSTAKQAKAPPPDQNVVKDVADYAGQRMSQAVDKKVRGMFGSFLGKK